MTLAQTEEDFAEEDETLEKFLRPFRQEVDDAMEAQRARDAAGDGPYRISNRGAGLASLSGPSLGPEKITVNADDVDIRCDLLNLLHHVKALRQDVAKIGKPKRPF